MASTMVRELLLRMFIAFCLLLNIVVLHWWVFNSPTHQELPTFPKQSEVPTKSSRPAQRSARLSFPVLDIVSSGSISRIDHLNAQRETFGSHFAVRNFITLTEHNDTDSRCHLDVTEKDVEEIVTFCHAAYENQTKASQQIRQKKFLPKIHPGWMCAQKRPIDGLQRIFQQYRQQPLPDYLMLIDDDTYINVQDTLKFLAEFHPSNVSNTVAGCRLFGPIQIHFAFPIGGFGSIFTKQALKRFMHPIDCDNIETKDKFTQFACWRLEQNEQLERTFFQNGMSVADLNKYANVLPFFKTQRLE